MTTETAKKSKWSSKKKVPEKTQVKKKEVKQEKEDKTRKEIKRERKERENPNYHVELTLKKMWETLRNVDTDEKRAIEVDKILAKITTEEKSMLDFAFAHDTTRVLQSCLQHGTHAQRRTIFEAVKPRIPEMAKEKYAKNIIWKLIKYGERDIKDHCIANLGNVRKLVRSNIGQSVLEYAYNQFAQSNQRSQIISNLYGKTYCRLAKMDPGITILDCCKKNMNFVLPILTDFMEDLKSLTEKEVITQTVSHRAFLDFFNTTMYLLNMDDAKATEHREKIGQIRSELIEQLRASVIHMLHTPDGARVGLHCIWWGTAKDRKLIIKTMKEFLDKVVKAEFGHILLFGTIDAVDDTVAVKKSLISGLLKDLDSLMDDKYAKKVFWYLTAGRDRRFLLPDVIKLLEIGDSSTTTKKPRDVKLDQLQADAIPVLMEWFSENIDKCVKDSTLCPLMVAVMSHSDHIKKGDENMLLTVQRALAKKLAHGTYSDPEHPLQKPHISLSLKKLFTVDKDRTCDRLVTQVVTECAETVHTWLGDNRGSFLILQMLEVNDQKANEILKENLEETILSKKKDLQKTKGGELLLSKAFNGNEMRIELDDFSRDEPAAKRKRRE